MASIFISHSSADNAAAEQMKRWLETQGHTSLFLDFDPESGIKGGSGWEQTLYRQLRQCQAVIALLTPNWLASKWCFAELVQARESGKAIFPVKIAPCEGGWVFSDIQHIDLVDHPEDGYRRLKIGLLERGLDPLDVFVWDGNRSPYPGLMAFQEEDAAVFFGRGEEILKTLETLDLLRRRGGDEARFVLLLGASGSGKSSLMRAGVIPRLRKKTSEWMPLPPFRPLVEPLDELAMAVSAAFESQGRAREWSALRGVLHAAAERSPVDGSALLEIGRDLAVAARQPDATLLITIDQAEELFGYSPPEAAGRFLLLLRAALEAADHRLMAVATMRSDFLAEFQNHPALQDSVHAHHFRYRAVPVDPMPFRNFPKIIQGPARLAGLELEEGLVEAMVSDTGARDALPLLAFMLRRLYERHGQDGRLSLSEYEAIGRLEGAVREVAQQVITDTDPSVEELEALRAAFVPAMVRINVEGAYARRRALLDDMPRRAVPMLRRFVNARLLVTDRDPEGHETIEVAHEALLRTWPQLGGWLAEDRDKLRLLESIQRSTEEWDQGGREDDLLVHRDGRLKDAETLLSNPRFTLPESSSERAYLNACIAAQQAREAEEKEEQERRIRDAESIAEEQMKSAEAQKSRADAEARRVRYARIGLLIVTVLLAVAGTFAWLAYKERQTARFQLASVLWVNGVNERDHNDDPLKAGHHFMQASALASDEITAKHALLAASTATGDVFLEAILEHGGPVEAASFTQNDSRVITWSGNGEMRVWNTNGKTLDSQRFGEGFGKAYLSPAGSRILLSTGKSRFMILDSQTGLLLMNVSHEAGIPAFNANESRLLTWTSRENAQLWDIPGGRRISTLPHEHPVRGAVLSHSGERILTWSEDGPAWLWDAKQGKGLAMSPLLQTGVLGAAFSMDESKILIWDTQGIVRLWSDQRGQIDIPLPSGGYGHPTLRAYFFQNDERILILNHGGLGSVHVADSRNGALLYSLTQHKDAVSTAVFTRSQERLLTGGDDRTAQLWDSRTGTETFPAFQHRGRVLGAVFNGDETKILTWSEDGTARVWDAQSGLYVGQMTHRESVRGASFSKDQKKVLTWSNDGSVRIWGISDRTRSIALKHDDRVLCAAYREEDDRLLTMSKDNRLRVWSNQGELLRSYELTSDVMGARFSLDERVDRLLTWEGNGKIRVWSTHSGEPLTPSFRHDSLDRASLGAAFGPNGRWVLSWADDGAVRVWDGQTTSPLISKQHAACVLGAELSEDGNFILTWTDNREVHLWDKGREVPLCTFPHGLGVKGAALTKDGSRILSWGTDGIGRVWDVHCGADFIPFIPFEHGKAIRGARFDRSEERVLSWSEDGKARIWDSRRPNKELTPALPHDDVLGGVFSIDGNQVLSWCEQGKLRLWDSRNGYPLTRPLSIRYNAGPIYSASFIQKDHKILIVTFDTVWVLNLGTNNERLLEKFARYPRSKVDEVKAKQEIITGTRLSNANEIEVLSSAEWAKCKSRFGPCAPPCEN